MARIIEKLTPLTVSRQKTKGMYHDGGGLYLRVKADGGKSWAFRYTLHGKAREMGLGGFPAVSLADARNAANGCRKMLTMGQDPIKNRDEKRAMERLADANTRTFRQCAEDYIDAHKSGWRNPKHIQQWSNTLRDYAYPFIGDMSVADVDVFQVISILEQKNKAFAKGETLWTARTETASRLRGRIEVILDWARVRGYRTGENPARWRGHLQNLLPPPSKVQRVRHQPALPYDQVGDFYHLLNDQEGLAARVLQFVILTACRTSEAIGARWEEMDMERRIWTIPAHRIKAGREHRVPLSPEVISLLESFGGTQNEGYVFAGQKKGRPLSNMAMLVLLRRMNRADITVHGFRSSFRDWCAEQTSYPREVAEAALAHAVGDKIEAAYRRSDLFDKRREMMEEWARYVK